jgi:acid phosphatase
MGSTWLNATTKLLLQGPSAGPFFFSFTHDSDMIPTFNMLDLFHDDIPLPTTHVVKSRKWKTSQMVPMGGRLVIERLSCEDSKSQRSPYVRLNINDGIVALPGCKSGPGSSCPLNEFVSMMEQRLAKAGDFRSMCGLPDSAPDGITFLKQG